MQDKPAARAEVLKFFDWAMKNGQKMAEELDYVPMPRPWSRHGRSGLEGASQGRIRQGALELADVARVSTHDSAGRDLRSRPFCVEANMTSAVSATLTMPADRRPPAHDASRIRRRSPAARRAWQDCVVRNARRCSSRCSCWRRCWPILVALSIAAVPAHSKVRIGFFCHRRLESRSRRISARWRRSTARS